MQPVDYRMFCFDPDSRQASRSVGHVRDGLTTDHYAVVAHRGFVKIAVTFRVFLRYARTGIFFAVPLVCRVPVWQVPRYCRQKGWTTGV